MSLIVVSLAAAFLAGACAKQIGAAAIIAIQHRMNVFFITQFLSGLRGTRRALSDTDRGFQAVRITRLEAKVVPAADAMKMSVVAGQAALMTRSTRTLVA